MAVIRINQNHKSHHCRSITQDKLNARDISTQAHLKLYARARASPSLGNLEKISRVEKENREALKPAKQQIAQNYN